MKTTKFYFTSFSLLLFFSLLIINFSSAKNVNANWLDRVSSGGLNNAAVAYGQNPDDPNRLIFTIAFLINMILGLLGIIFLGLILYAGFNYMTAVGEEEKITKAKETITRAIIGLIIILASFAITKFVVNAIVSSTA